MFAQLAREATESMRNLRNSKRLASGLLVTMWFCALSWGQARAREDWGAVPASVSRDNDGSWTIAGKKNTVTLDARDQTIHIQSGPVHWKTLPPTAKDLVVKRRGETFSLDLRDARKINVEPYDTGYMNGVKLTVADWEKAPD